MLDDLGLEDLDDQGRKGRLEWLPDLGQPFVDLIDDERILPYLLAFVDDYVRLDHSYGIQMMDGSPGLGLHGEPDNRAPNCAWYHVRNGVISAGLTVVSYALTDVPADAGGFVCVPGSHKANFSSPYLDQAATAVREHLAHAELRAGDAVIFTEALTHGSLDWAGPSVRRALFYKYAPGHASWLDYRWAERDLERLTPRQRQVVAPPGVFDGVTAQARQPIALADQEHRPHRG
ncbi:phytanoyl-CoA dioxygenase family protein [Tenggerimyces flavus]|uniref:Phytanoyl-CoA dioxygenase family protein n=1 Tax=Tenggerimyces flavus TaxID=1708749 RepID=A0ABV7Y497_9ACTN|nr:phytanoyl-CoA dioxygenase family protein [Tenggerimyces flavus]MBM7788359.1 hypothetical protein [Tenggerimyces flavus]